MLQLRDIKKDYVLGDESVHALRGVSASFRDSEFVAILGHSGCGKTTLLNIIGGLDKYTSGDLMIDGVSTKKFRDCDWDAYRNHSIGFVFQSYNLIPHQTVLANVELALTISGISKSERRRRAVEALERVGLGDQLKKKPGQMSGGQMQRVAIARALVNDPEILLADEPTGALDSETSVQVMELIREIARDRLVIMVTHNPELAERYATRIIRIKDGEVVSDTDPYEPTVAEKVRPHASVSKSKRGRVSMSFWTALSLSLNNLMTKKGRTFMTSFAGSIGIIGIALILSLSNGINTYINNVQKDTLSSYPITITRENDDSMAMISQLMKQNHTDDGEGDERTDDRVYSNTVMYDMFNSVNSALGSVNDLEKFKKFLDSDEEIAEYASAVQYGYDSRMPVFTEDESGKIIEADLAKVFTDAMGDGTSAMFQSKYSMFSNAELFEEMLCSDDGSVSDDVTKSYDLVYGSWPNAYDETVLIVNSRNEISDMVLYAIGLKDSSKISELMTAAMSGEEIGDPGTTSWTYEDICAKKYKLILPSEMYAKNASGSYTDMSETDAGLEYLYKSDDVGTELKIVGIIRPSEGSDANMLIGVIGYTRALTDYVIDAAQNSEILQAQLADSKTDVISGLLFKTPDVTEPDAAQKKADILAYIESLTPEMQAKIFRYISSIPDDSYVSAVIEQSLSSLTREQIEEQVLGEYAAQMGVDEDAVRNYIVQMSDDELRSSVADGMREMIEKQYAETVGQQLSGMPDAALAAQLLSGDFSDTQYGLMYDEFMAKQYSDSTYDDNLTLLGYVSADRPDTINIYADTFADKNRIADVISRYNDSVSEDDAISYTDYVALLMSSVTDIISGVSYLLIAFVSISLVVSSIMIGIITYISVLERTREIGILRAIGASKHDISSVFNAETLIVGFVSGMIGIGVSVLLCFPINAIIHHLTDLTDLSASLPVTGAVVLVAISMALTLIAGLIPSRFAAKKDPVVALRSE